MAKYNIKCADGGDRHCHGTVEVEIEVENLSIEQIQELEDNGQTHLNKEQVEISNIKLNEEQRQILSSSGEVYYDCDINNTCAACGSDQDHDTEGNNTTAS